jgi:hypothetical protein
VPDVSVVREWRRAIVNDLADLDRSGVLVTSAPLRRLRGSPGFSAGAALVWIFRGQIIESTGRCLEELVVPVRLAVRRDDVVRSTREARTLVERLFSHLGRVLTSRAEAVAERRLITITHLHGKAVQTEHARERAIREVLDAAPHEWLQAGLFDVRAVRDRNRARSLGQAARADVDSRMFSLDAVQEVQLARPPELAMVLIVGDCRS